MTAERPDMCRHEQPQQVTQELDGSDVPIAEGPA